MIRAVNTITVVIMEVPCCGGLSQMVSMAAEMASRKVPVKEVVISIRGDVLSEDGFKASPNLPNGRNLEKDKCKLAIGRTKL